MEKASYTSKKGKRVEVTLTPHTIQRFCDRAPRLIGEIDNPVETIKQLISNAIVLDTRKEKNKKYKKRMRGDEIYLRNSHFTFVVVDQIVKTVEISAKGYRFANREKFGAY